MSSTAPGPLDATGENKKEDRKRTRVALSLTTEEFHQVCDKAGRMPPAAWCKERVLLSDDFADPSADLVSQGLLAAASLRQHQSFYIEVFELGYQLIEAIHRRPLGQHGDQQVRDLAHRLETTLFQLSSDREEMLGILQDLMRLRREMSGRRPTRS